MDKRWTLNSYNFISFYKKKNFTDIFTATIFCCEEMFFQPCKLFHDWRAEWWRKTVRNNAVVLRQEKMIFVLH